MSVESSKRNTEKENRIQRRVRTCRYFNGIQHSKCKKDIEYSSVRDVTIKPFSYPCLNPDCSIVCASADRYTAEEAEAREKEIIESLFKVNMARAAILEASENRKNYSSSIDCPVCQKGKLNYSIVSNGHIHAACSQLNCVKWME